MPSQNAVTWSSMILGHVKCGQGQKALGLFQQMQQEGVQPDSVTFVGVLQACASRVAIEEGRCVHQDIIQSGLESDVFVGSSLVNMYAKLEHYNCLVDLLGHAGHLQEVENMVNAMSWKPHVAAWMALLGACRIHGNVEMAERVARRILEMEPDNAADYGLPSNIYAGAGNRHLCENVKLEIGKMWDEIAALHLDSSEQ